MPRDPKVGPVPTGSFVSEEAIKDRIAQRQIDEEQEEEKVEEKAEEEKQAPSEEKLIPDNVNSVLGTVSYERFKAWYKALWEQVESNQHLAQGFCTFSQEIAPGLSVTLKTFSNIETRVIRRLSPNTRPEGDLGKFMADDMEHRNFQIVFGVLSFAGEPCPRIPLPKDDLETWKASEEIQSRLRWAEGLPEEVIDLIGGILADVTIAYRFALRENLKNRLAPL